jgi:hypothetical protein
MVGCYSRTVVPDFKKIFLIKLFPQKIVEVIETFKTLAQLWDQL